jgi:hypothetical protein
MNGTVETTTCDMKCVGEIEETLSWVETEVGLGSVRLGNVRLG